MVPEFAVTDAKTSQVDLIFIQSCGILIAFRDQIAGQTVQGVKTTKRQPVYKMIFQPMGKPIRSIWPSPDKFIQVESIDATPIHKHLIAEQALKKLDNNGNGKLDYSEMQAWIDWMEKEQISWAIWSVADKNESCSILRPTAGSEGKWKENDMTESGNYDRKLIRSFSLDKK